MGGFVLLFLVKPLFAPRARRAPSLALNPAAEPLLFAFIHMVADVVGAPRPARVEVDCRLNASAGLRGGLAGLTGRELVLTLGLPLVATLDARQLAGVVAHEFGHFNQAFGLRASQLVRAVSGWLGRVAYERDAWDEALERWVAAAPPARAHLILGGARLGVWFSRSLLKLFLLCSHAVSCLLLRQMERDADRCQVTVAGSEAFITTLLRRRVLGEVAREFYRQIRRDWDRHRRLPDNLPAALAAADAAFPPDRKVRLTERTYSVEAGIFDTHPSDTERLEAARAAPAPGLFHLAQPAPALFANFDALARQVTLLHYEDDLGLPRAEIELTPPPWSRQVPDHQPPGARGRGDDTPGGR